MSRETSYDREFFGSAHFEILAAGDVNAQWTTITHTMNAIERAHYPYLAVNFNSNSAIKTAVDAAGLQIPYKWLWQAPGLQTNLIENGGEYRYSYDRPGPADAINESANSLIHRLTGVDVSNLSNAQINRCFPPNTPIGIVRRN